MASELPNILWICTDQQRWDTVHCLNNPHIHTPVVDRLCAEGVAFSRTYCQSPVCQPSRASFLTGLYANTIHVNRNGNAYFPVNERVRLITRRLADRGYDCGLAGKLAHRLLLDRRGAARGRRLPGVRLQPVGAAVRRPAATPTPTG